MNPVEITIEELILHGFKPGDRRRIGEVVEMELARLISEEGAPALMSESRTISRLDSGSVQMGRNSKPEDVAGEIARSVYMSLSGARSS